LNPLVAIFSNKSLAQLQQLLHLLLQLLHPAVATPTKFSLFAYDVGDAMDKHVLSSAIERYFSNKKLSKQQMNHRVQHMQQNIQSGKLNATTIKQLIALSDASMEHFTSFYAAKMRHEIKQINNDIPIKIVADAINQYENIKQQR
jgi:hypothetical protein